MLTDSFKGSIEGGEKKIQMILSFMNEGDWCVAGNPHAYATSWSWQKNCFQLFSTHLRVAQFS